MPLNKTRESGPWEDRTPDQRIKSPLLYLTELTAHICYAALELVTLLACCVKGIIQGYAAFRILDFELHTQIASAWAKQIKLVVRYGIWVQSGLMSKMWV